MAEETKSEEIQSDAPQANEAAVVVTPEPTPETPAAPEWNGSGNFADGTATNVHGRPV